MSLTVETRTIGDVGLSHPPFAYEGRNRVMAELRARFRFSCVAERT